MSETKEPVSPFLAWSRKWTWAPSEDQKRAIEGAADGVGVFRGARFVDGVEESDRIRKVLSLCRELGSLPATWQREMSKMLASGRKIDKLRLDPEQHYVRGDYDPDSPPKKAPEHALEWSVLKAFEAGGLSSLGGDVVDAVNAVPLTKDSGGGRAGNVEIDIVFLVKAHEGYALQLVEAKQGSNDPWFAVVEALRQLVLFNASNESAVVRQLMCERNKELNLEAAALSAKSVVLAPAAFYDDDGKKFNAVEPARRLIKSAADELGAQCDLAIWDQDRRQIRTH